MVEMGVGEDVASNLDELLSVGIDIEPDTMGEVEVVLLDAPDV